nr:BatD family protein [Candidatus Babeliales bacterium]
EVGVPFFVRVTANNVDTQGQPKGFDQWSHIAISFAGTSQSTRIVNGNRSQSVTYQYIATADIKGKLHCPALSVQDRSGNTITSDPIEIVVGDNAEIINHQNNDVQYVLNVQLNQKKFYLGQKISVKLRFGYQQDFSNLQLGQGSMDSFHQGYVQTQASDGSFELNEKTYKSKDFLIELYPQRIGTLTIPTYKAVFVPDVSYRQTLSLFSMMSGNSVIESLPRSVIVEPLPVSMKYPNVTAIGTFDSVELSLSSQTGKVGEGIVVKMIVKGDGNLEVVRHPALQLPQELQYYEGNSKNIDQSTKEFEWIIQAEYPGTFEIESQKFVYFDTKQEEYQVLQSKPVTLTVSGIVPLQNQQNVVPQTQENLSTQAKQEVFTSTMHEPEILSLSWTEKIQNIWSDIKQWVQQTALSRKGTIKIVEILVLLLLLIGTVLIVRRFIKTSFFIKTLSIRIQFARACRNKDMHAVYQLFEQLMVRYGLSFESEELQHCFTQKNMPEESFENWKNFVTMIWEINFAKDRATSEHDLAFTLAKQWFSVILSCCKMRYNK